MSVSGGGTADRHNNWDGGASAYLMAKRGNVNIYGMLEYANGVNDYIQRDSTSYGDAGFLIENRDAYSRSNTLSSMANLEWMIKPNHSLNVNVYAYKDNGKSDITDLTLYGKDRSSSVNEGRTADDLLSGTIDMAVVLLLSMVPSGLLAVLLGRTVTENWKILHLGAFGMVMLVAAVYSLLCGQATLGNRLTGLRLMQETGEAATRLQSAYRMVLEHVCVTAIPFWIYFSIRISADKVSIVNVVWLGMGAFLMMCAARNVLEMMFNAVTHGSSMLYDRLTGTRLCYGSSKRPLFGIRVLDILPLEAANVDCLSRTVCDTLAAVGFGHEAVTKVRLMTEGVMLEWMAAGLQGTPCELRLDKHFFQKALILSIPVAGDGGVAPVNATEESYLDMFSNMTLKLESYRASRKNVCIIHIP